MKDRRFKARQAPCSKGTPTAFTIVDNPQYFATYGYFLRNLII